MKTFIVAQANSAGMFFFWAEKNFFFLIATKQLFGEKIMFIKNDILNIDVWVDINVQNIIFFNQYFFSKKLCSCNFSIKKFPFIPKILTLWIWHRAAQGAIPS